MKSIAVRLFILTCFIIGGPGFHSAGAAPDEMNPLRQQYELDLEGGEAKVRALDENYVAALKRMQGGEEKAGNLNAVLAIRKEIEIHGDGTDYELEKFKARASDYPALRNMQSKYLVERDKIERSSTQELLQAAMNYHDRLEKLSVDLTKNSRIDDAVAVTEERDRIAELIASMVKPSEESKEMPESEPVRARAHLVAKAEAELFQNGKSVYLRRSDEEHQNGTDAKSGFFEISPGDVIVVRVRGTAVFRSLALALELPDEDSAIFFESGDVKVVGTGESADPAEIDAKVIEAAPEIHPQNTIPDQPWVDAWNEHRLGGGGFLKPEPQSEWVLWGIVLTKDMLERKSQ